MKQKDFDLHEGAAILTKNQGYTLEDYVSYAIIRIAFHKAYSKKIPFSLVRCPKTDASRVGVRLGCLTLEESYIIVDDCNVDSVLALWEKYGRFCIERKEWESRSESEKKSVMLAVRENIWNFFLGNSDVMEDMMRAFNSTWDESNDCYKMDGIRGVINNNRSLLQQATNVIESMLNRFIVQANNSANISTKFHAALNRAKNNLLMKLDQDEYIIIFTEPFHVTHIESTIKNALSGSIGESIIRIFIQENTKSSGVEYYARGISYDTLIESDCYNTFNLNYNALAYTYAPAIKIISEDGNSIGCADLDTLIDYCHVVYDAWKSDCLIYAEESVEEDHNLLGKIDTKSLVEDYPSLTSVKDETGKEKKKREPLVVALKRRMLEICSVK